MKDILSEIIANKRFEVDLQKQAISIEQLQEGISEMPSSRSMKQALISSVSGNYSRVQTSFSVQRLDKAGGSSGRNSSGLCGCGGLCALYPHG